MMLDMILLLNMTSHLLFKKKKSSVSLFYWDSNRVAGYFITVLYFNYDSSGYFELE